MTGNEYNLLTVCGLGQYWGPRCSFDLGVILAVIENKFDSAYSKTNSKQKIGDKNIVSHIDRVKK